MVSPLMLDMLLISVPDWIVPPQLEDSNVQERDATLELVAKSLLMFPQELGTFGQVELTPIPKLIVELVGVNV